MSGQRRHGRIAALDTTGAVRFGDFDCYRHAAGVLASVFTMAREIFAGGDHRIASGIAADGAWVLHAHRDGTARAAGRIVADGVWTRTSVYVQWLGDCFGAGP